MPGEVLRPGLDLGILSDQFATLALCHTAPDSELDLVVEGVGEALGDDVALTADDGRAFLCRTGHEEFVGISGATPRLRDPCESPLAYERS
jgi:hypothetical protein